MLPWLAIALIKLSISDGASASAVSDSTSPSLALAIRGLASCTPPLANAIGSLWSTMEAGAQAKSLGCFFFILCHLVD